MAQMVKNSPVKWETWVRSLGWEDPLEEGMATHSSILAWRIPMDRGAWRATGHGVTKSWTQLKRLSTEHHMSQSSTEKMLCPQQLLIKSCCKSIICKSRTVKTQMPIHRRVATHEGPCTHYKSGGFLFVQWTHMEHFLGYTDWKKNEKDYI